MDGIKYVLKEYTWGEDLEVGNSIVKFESVNGKLKPTVDLARNSVLTLKTALKSWTFRGYDENGKLRQEGDIVPIAEENVKMLPVKHGTELLKLAEELNNIRHESIEAKN